MCVKGLARTGRNPATPSCSAIFVRPQLRTLCEKARGFSEMKLASDEKNNAVLHLFSVTGRKTVETRENCKNRKNPENWLLFSSNPSGLFIRLARNHLDSLWPSRTQNREKLAENGTYWLGLCFPTNSIPRVPFFFLV